MCDKATRYHHVVFGRNNKTDLDRNGREKWTSVVVGMDGEAKKRCHPVVVVVVVRASRPYTVLRGRGEMRVWRHEVSRGNHEWVSKGGDDAPSELVMITQRTKSPNNPLR